MRAFGLSSDDVSALGRTVHQPKLLFLALLDS